MARSRRLVLVLVGAAALVTLGVAAYHVDRGRREAKAIRHNNLGVALMEEGLSHSDYRAAAIEELETAVRLQPGDVTTRVNLGLARFYTAQATAREALEGLLRDHPEDPFVRLALGHVLLQSNPAAAAEHFQAVLAVDPHDVATLLALAQALFGNGQATEALQVIERTGVQRTSAAAAYLVMRALQQLGRLEEALEAGKSFKELSQRRDKDSSLFVWADGKPDPAILREKFLQPTGRSRPLKERTEPAPRYRDVTREAGIAFQHAGAAKDPQVEAVLRGDPVPREQLGAAASRRRVASAIAASASFTDLDGDGRLDLLLVNAGGQHALYRQAVPGKFADVAATAGLAVEPELGTTGVWADADQDADLDLFLGGYGDARLLENNAGTLREAPASGAIQAAVGGSWCATSAWADVDHDGDLDLYIGRLPDLEKPADGKSQVRFPADFRTPGDLLLRNNGDGTFADISSAALPESDGAATRAVLFTDLDDDAAIDAVLFDLTGAPRALINRRDFTFAAGSRLPPGLPSPPPPGEARAHGDYDGDGGVDLLLSRAGEAAQLLHNETPPERWLTVRLRGEQRNQKRDRSNTLGVGAKVEIRALGLWKRKELRAGNGLGGSDAPEVYFDLGDVEELDFVRAFFPTGIRSAQKEVKASQAITVVERLIPRNSCPAVFAWDGERFRFITDAIGAGVVAELVGPGEYWQPDPDEWIRIAPGQLRPRGASLELRFVNPLEEVTYADGFRLVAVDAPAGLAVHPDERMVSDPQRRRPAAILVLGAPRAIVAATDHAGRDVASALARIDHAPFGGFEPTPFEGLVADWSLTLDLGPRPGEVLLLHGWTKWTSAASARAAGQAGLAPRGPALDVLGLDGAWREAQADLGVPAGLPRTMVARLEGLLRSGERVVRIRSNRTVYFDHAVTADLAAAIDPASLATSSPALAARVVEVPLRRAELRWLGYPRVTSPGGSGPEHFDYSRIDDAADWYTHRGLLTRRGDVTPLLRAVDDEFVVMGHGEEIALDFDAASLPPPPEGWTRTYLLHANGFEKGYDPYTSETDRVEPLPYRLERPAEDRTAYELEWNTRDALSGWR